MFKKHHISFQNAWNGVRWAFTTQPNFKIHFLLSLIAISLGLVLKISLIELTIVILIIVFGFGIEMVNTSIEAMTDLITTKWNQEAKIAKDVSAGMMLLFAVGAVIIAILIFIPKLIRLYL